MAEDQEKTEEPTPKKREEARKKGQVPRSQDLNTAALLLAAIGLLYVVGGGIRNSFARMMVWAFGQMHQVDLSQAGISALFVGLVKEITVMVLPLSVGLMVFGLAISFAQSGLMISWEAMEPKWNKLDPIKGMKNLFSLQSVMRVLMSILKLTVITVVTYWAVVKDLPILFGLSGYEVRSIFAVASEVVFWMVFKMALAMFVLAVFDYMYQRYNHEKQLKMSRQEIKEEMKQMEGDPQIKGAIRRKMMEASFRRMMQSVPEADVVVTNPTHYAIALKYDPLRAEAPIVLAKGQRLIAQRIKEIARENDVPIVEDKPLARSLYKTVEVGEQVPPALYRAVAKVIGYIYRMKKKKVSRRA